MRPNAQRAARWYAKAAEQGLPSAMYDHGVLLHNMRRLLWLERQPALA